MDFCFFADVAEKPLPPGAAGAALEELLRRDLLPSYAIGPWCEDLQRAAKDQPIPDRLVLAAEDALLLAPWRPDAEHWAGFLIAEHGAGGQQRAFYSEDGDRVDLLVPEALIGRVAVAARAGAVLPMVAGKLGQPSAVETPP